MNGARLAVLALLLATYGVSTASASGLPAPDPRICWHSTITDGWVRYDRDAGLVELIDHIGEPPRHSWTVPLELWPVDLRAPLIVPLHEQGLVVLIKPVGHRGLDDVAVSVLQPDRKRIDVTVSDIARVSGERIPPISLKQIDPTVIGGGLEGAWRLDASALTTESLVLRAGEPEITFPVDRASEDARLVTLDHRSGALIKGPPRVMLPRLRLPTTQPCDERPLEQRPVRCDGNDDRRLPACGACSYSMVAVPPDLLDGNEHTFDFLGRTATIAFMPFSGTPLSAVEDAYWNSLVRQQPDSSSMFGRGTIDDGSGPPIPLVGRASEPGYGFEWRAGKDIFFFLSAEACFVGPVAPDAMAVFRPEDRM